MPSPSSRSENNPTTQDGRRGGLKLHTTTPFFRPSSSSSSSSSSTTSPPLPPSPPPTPCPWLWRCHSCYTIYRLAVTRRCLDCDHTFCLGDAAGATASSTGAATKGSKKRKRGGPCKAEFDYTGWKSRGAWRRTMLLNDGDNNNQRDRRGRRKNWGDEHKAATAATATEKAGDELEARHFDDKREHLFLRKQHNCFLHCDFPSECHHALFRAQQEGRPILREALALDAAREAAVAKTGHASTAEGGKQQQHHHHQARRRRSSSSSATTAAMAATRFFFSKQDLLPSVDEEAGDGYDEEGEDNVSSPSSPCSPPSPDPPGDLMREVQQQVSPIEGGDSDEQQLPPVVSPGGTQQQRRRRSLLVATDTPVDFATTAAPLCFEDDDGEGEGEDTYSDNDDDEEDESEENKRRSKSRRKVAQITGEEEHARAEEVFGPFVFDNMSSSPTTSPASSSGGGGGGGSTVFLPTAAAPQALDLDLDLQAAYSEQAWFNSSSSSQHPTGTVTAEGQQQPPPSPLSPKSPERMGKRDRMFALLGRRAGGGGGGGGGGLSPSSPTQSPREASFNDVPSGAHQHHHHHHHQQQQQQQHATTTVKERKDCSDSHPPSSSSSPVSPTTISSTASGPEPDADGDVAMRDVDKEHDDEADEEHLRALLRMRNAFMRGDMR